MLNQHPRLAEISKAVRDQVVLLLDEKGLAVRNIRSDDRLNADLGLTSLDLATLVAALETKLKADPFQDLVPITSVRTIGDLETAFVRFFSRTEDGFHDDDLAKVRRRAESGRGRSGCLE